MVERSTALFVGSVDRVEDLPLNDPIGTVRRVNADGLFYRCITFDLNVTRQWEVFGVASEPGEPEEPEIDLGAGITVSWDDLSFDEDGFRVYYGTNGVNFPSTVEVGVNVETVDIGNLVDGQRYYFYVVSFNEAGESDPTPVESAYAGTQPPEQVWVVEQNFETPVTGYDNGETWSPTVTDAVIDPIYGAAPLKGGQSLRIYGTANTANTSYTYHDFPAPLDNFWVHCRRNCLVLSGQQFYSLFVGGSGNNLGISSDVGEAGRFHNLIRYNGATLVDSVYQSFSPAVNYIWMQIVRNGTGKLWVGLTPTRPSAVDNLGGTQAYVEFACPDQAMNYICLSNNAGWGDFIFDNVLVSEAEIEDDPSPT